MYPVVEVWFEAMRAAGHSVFKEDFVHEWASAARFYLEALEAKVKRGEQLGAHEKQRQDVLDVRLKSLSVQHRRKFLANEVQRFLQARCLKPQRVLTLSAEEEYQRAVMTWQLYDKTLWRLMNGEKEWMDEHFACPEQAREHMSECVLLFSDQIPCWLKVSPGRQMYCKHEVRSGKKEKQLLSHCFRR